MPGKESPNRLARGSKGSAWVACLTIASLMLFSILPSGVSYTQDDIDAVESELQGLYSEGAKIHVIEVLPLPVINRIINCATNHGALPVQFIGTNNDNLAIIHQNGLGELYVSWGMQSEMAIGVDNWTLASAFEQDQTKPGVPHGGNHGREIWHGAEFRSSDCREVEPFGADSFALGDYSYKIIGGGGGLQNESSCSYTVQWKFKAGAELNLIFTVRLLLGDGTLAAEFEYGESETCTDGITYDSEVLIGQSGESNLPGNYLKLWNDYDDEFVADVFVDWVEGL